MAAAAIIFAADNNDPKARARKHCLALRLNVRNEQLGWYSALPDTEHDDHLLWRLYGNAHDAYLHGNPTRSKEMCEKVNEL